MVVRKGYKKTEIGVIPEDWEVVQIGEIAKSSTEKNSLNKSLTVLTCSKHLGFVDSLSFFKNQVFSKDISTYKIIRKYEIGYPANHIEEGSIGYQNLYDEAVVSPIYIIITIDNRVNSLFIYKTLKRDYYKQIYKSLTSASVDRRGSLRWPIFSTIKIPLPPTFEEQTSIATVFSDADALIQSLEKLITKKRAIKQGAMQELLNPKEGWVRCRMIDVVEKYIDYRGRTPKKLGMDWGSGNILALSANNVQMGRIDTEKEAYLGSLELYKKWMLHGECEKDDVLLTMEAPLGNVAQIPDEKKYILSQRVLLIKPKKCITKNFLANFLKSTYFQKELFKNSSGSTAQGIQRQKLDQIEVFFPRIIEKQNRIATILSDMDAEISTLATKLTKYKQIKQGMMQNLLTGRIRLV